jgi:two-component system, LytTR family, sensor kinase
MCADPVFLCIVSSMTDGPEHVRSSRWLWIAAIWSAGGLVDALQSVLHMQAEQRHLPWLPIFGTSFGSWLPWALATPFVIGLARRYPIGRGVRPGAVAVHLATFAVITAVSQTWYTVLQILFNPFEERKWPTFAGTWSMLVLDQALVLLIAYTLILTVTYVVDAREKLASELVTTMRLNMELSRAQLAALRRQIEPHFMYNTLNAIAGLVRDRRNEAAVDMIVGLSEFLRRALEGSHRAQVSLAEEVEYLQRYIDIQTLRFGERLQVSLDIPEQLLRAKVPNLLLQPLVENAIKHGISKRVAGGMVRVSGSQHDGALRLCVYNDGPFATEDFDAARTGVGIGNLRTRLQILYGSRSQLTLGRGDPEGVEVVVTLPLVEA